MTEIKNRSPESLFWIHHETATIIIETSTNMKKRRLKNTDYVHIKSVLSTVIQNCRKESNTVLSDIRKTWNRELDKTFTDHAQPTALKGHTLLITVKSSTLSQQLRFLTNDILQMINANIGHYEISELKIKTGNF